MRLEFMVTQRVMAVAALIGCVLASCSPPPEIRTSYEMQERHEPSATTPSNATLAVTSEGADERVCFVDATSGASVSEMFLAVAKKYKSYPRVSDQANFAPTDCDVPPAGIQASVSGDEATHGKKLYYLYARIPDYMKMWAIPAGGCYVAPNGQVLVKETFAAEPSLSSPAILRQHGSSGATATSKCESEVVRGDGGEAYWIGRPKGLFIMAKVGDPGKRGTDNGWVYGTVSPDGAVVTAWGRIRSCIRCHERAPFDRQFGPKRLRDATARSESSPRGAR